MKNKDEMDYNCDKCGTLGNFTDGTMWGLGLNNIETCLCSYCLHKKTSDTFIAENLGK